MVISYKDARDRVSPYRDLDLVAGRSFAGAGEAAWDGLHPGAWNLIHVIAGCCRVRNGETETMLEPGGFFLLAPVERRIFERNGRWDAYWALFSLRLPLHWPEAEPGIYRLAPVGGEAGRMRRNLVETVNLAYECCGEWHGLACNLIDNMILRGNRYCQEKAPADRRMLLASKLLGRPENNMTIDGVAAQCGMSHAAFFVEFKRVFGVTPRSYREQARLQLARALLETERLSVGEIAVRANLIDGGYLTKRFRKYFGTTPMRYRAQLRSVDR